MPTTDEEHWANEARRLLNDATLAKALTDMRTEALVALGDVEATNADEIRTLQATARACIEFRDMLERYVIAGTPRKQEDPGVIR